MGLAEDGPMNADGYSRAANGASIATANYLAERMKERQPRFNLAELKVSLTVHLYPVCFTIDSSPIAYPYDEPYIQFIRALDSRRLTPDVLDVLKDCIFYEGCVAVEINDLRDALETNYRILLRPQFDIVVRDAASSISNDFDLLQVEKQMLVAASKPLCLIPDPTVFFVSSLINYCERRVQVRPKQIPKLLESMASIKPQKFSLHSFLLLRNGGRKVTFTGSGQGLPMFNVPPVSDIVQPYILPNLADSVNGKRSPINFEQFYNREICFDRPPARKVFFCVRVTQQKVLPRIYHGVFRVGTAPDTGTNGQKAMFALGSKERAVLFLEQLFLTFQREGYQKTILQYAPASQPSGASSSSSSSSSSSGGAAAQPSGGSAAPSPALSGLQVAQVAAPIVSTTPTAARLTPSTGVASAPVPPQTIRSRSSLTTSSAAAPSTGAKRK